MCNYVYDFGDDTLNYLYGENRLLYLYDFGYIDYPLYKCLSLIKGYKGYNTGITYKSDIRYSHKELIKGLLTNVLLWYKRSKIRLKHNAKKYLLQAIKDNTTVNKCNNTENYYKNTYVYIPRKNNEQYKKRVLSA